MGVLSNLEPASVFYYFEEICGIPHTSHHEKALSDYCVQFAKAHGLSCRQDEMGNVLIKAPATPGYEKEPGLILQGHLDMVGDKTAVLSFSIVREAMIPGTPQPEPISIGMNDLPERPNLRKILSIMNAIRAI